MEVKLGNYSWQEAANLVELDPIIVVPVGAFEQHGKHLPLKVDEFLVGRVAEEAAKKCSC
jgi:creatinine amidohydrolase